MTAAIVTNVTEFLGPAALAGLTEKGINVYAHDKQFTDASVRAAFEKEHLGTVALSAQTPEDIVEQAWQLEKNISILVSNDSFPAIHTPIEERAVDGLRDTLEAVVVFPYRLMGCAIDHLKRQDNPRVVMVTSSRTKLPMQGGAIPDAARAAQNALLKSLSIELAPHGIPVNSVAPNFVYSETYFPKAKFIEDETGANYIKSVVPRGRLGRQEEIAELIAYLATTKGSFMTGSIIDIDGGWPMAPVRPE